MEPRQDSAKAAGKQIAEGTSQLAKMAIKRLIQLGGAAKSKWTDGSLSKNRKIGIVAGVVFALSASAALMTAGALKDQTQGHQYTHIRAGGYICSRAHEVMGQRQIRNAGLSREFRGCEQIGASFRVNVIGSDSNFGAIQVGNHAGVAWVDEADIVYVD